MQKVNEIKRRCTVVDDQKLNFKKLEPSKINSDILYMISCISPTIFRILPRLYNITLNKQNIIKLKIDGMVESITEIDFLMYRNLQVLHFKDVRDLKLKYLHDIGCLILESMTSFEFLKNENFKVSKLVLKNIKIKYKSLVFLLKMLSPKALIFDRVELIDQKSCSAKILTECLLNLELLHFESKYSFIGLTYCMDLVKGLKKFLYLSNDKFLCYSQVGGFQYYLKTSSLRYIKSLHIEMNFEILHLESESDLIDLDLLQRRNIKHLILKRVTINTYFVKSFPSLITVDFTECHFPGLIFYELIKNNLKLTSFSSKNCELPLDCIHFIRSYIKGCLVNIKK
jgi:hypothetical protein